MHFQQKVIKFVLDYVPIFETNIFNIKKTNNALTSVENWKFRTCVPLKTLVTENHDCLLLQHMAKKILFSPLKKDVSIPYWIYYHIGA